MREDYLWRWNARVLAQGRPQQVKAAFRQTDFLPPTPARPRKLAEHHQPALNEEGELTRFILSRMDGSASLGEVARQVLAKFPGRFANWHEALARVGELSEKYSR